MQGTVPDFQVDGCLSFFESQQHGSGYRRSHKVLEQVYQSSVRIDDQAAQFMEFPQITAIVKPYDHLFGADKLIDHLCKFIIFIIRQHQHDGIGLAGFQLLQRFERQAFNHSYFNIAGIINFLRLFKRCNDNFPSVLFQLTGKGQRLILKAEDDGILHSVEPGYVGPLMTFAHFIERPLKQRRPDKLIEHDDRDDYRGKLIAPLRKFERHFHRQPQPDTCLRDVGHPSDGAVQRGIFCEITPNPCPQHHGDQPHQKQYNGDKPYFHEHIERDHHAREREKSNVDIRPCFLDNKLKLRPELAVIRDYKTADNANEQGLKKQLKTE